MVFELAIYYFVEAMWFILPAYAANGFAPVFRGKVPIDGGRKLKDGKRIFGDGKTRKGFFGGVFMATLIGTIQMILMPYVPFGISPIPLEIVAMGPVLGFLLGFGALTGDLVGSFVKRRLDIKKGKPAPVLDQIDFIIGALVFTFIVVGIKAQWVVALILVTPLFHVLMNVLGYLLKIKDEPY